MLKEEDMSFIEEKAYIPEHIYPYVESVSGAEVHLFKPFLSYITGKNLIFVGFQLEGPFDEKGLVSILQEMIQKSKSETISLITPKYPIKNIPYRLLGSDFYYRIDLENFKLSSKVRNMVNRAQQVVYIQREKRFSAKHEELLFRFIKERTLDQSTSFILEKMDTYIKSSETVHLLSAYGKDGELIAFDVVDTFSKDYVFYMFNIRSKTKYVPGTSDLLFSEIVRIGYETKKRYVNLGLGINEGITFFKKKWGGKAFIPYFFLELKKKRGAFFTFFSDFISRLFF